MVRQYFFALAGGYRLSWNSAFGLRAARNSGSRIRSPVKIRPGLLGAFIGSNLSRDPAAFTVYQLSPCVCAKSIPSRLKNLVPGGKEWAVDESIMTLIETLQLRLQLEQNVRLRIRPSVFHRNIL
jgi:hypothetical protein